MTEVPPPATLAAGPQDDDILNILLLGSDTDNPRNAGRTDAILIVSLNRTAGTASLLSIPRDLFVYIPGWNMQRINTAFGHGQQQDSTDGGYRLLKDTILYNLGIRIDFHARVDFADFRGIVDALGGVDVSVPCSLQDWRLKADDLDPQQEDNWELFTLGVGVRRLDGATALWYARSRRTSNDFDRGRRQQDLIRAIWRRARELGLISQIPALWPQLSAAVETDMRLDDLLGLVPMALSLDDSQITHYTLTANVDVHSWRTPDGASVLLPVPEAIQRLVGYFMQPSTGNRLVQGGPLVEIVNAGGFTGIDQVVADRLAWAGFAAAPVGSGGQGRSQSVVYDFTGRTKGSVLEALLSTLGLNAEDVIVEPQAERAADYRVLLGSAYRTCIFNVMPPVTATPDPVPAE